MLTWFRGAAGVSPAGVGTRSEALLAGEVATRPAMLPTTAPPRAMKQKDQTIETLRGLAIVCVVIGHVIGDSASSGLAVGPRSLYRYWYDATTYLRMPMFFAISGFLYAHRPVVPGKYAEFARGKLRLLLLPFLSVATLQYLLKSTMPGVNIAMALHDMGRIYFYGFDQFWFSQATMLTFATVLVLEFLLPIAAPGKWLAYLLLAIAFDLTGPKMALFSQNYFAAMLPVFFLGCLLYRPPAWLQGRIALATALVIFLAAFAIQQLYWFGRISLHDAHLPWLRRTEALSFIYLLFRYRWATPALAVIGGYAYPIYLFHVFGTAGSRILMVNLGIGQRFALFVVGVLCGLGAPIVIERILVRSPVMRRVFLGRR